MNALNLSWAIYTMPAVKAAAEDPIKRETGRDIYQRQGLCGSIRCYQCPLLHNGVCGTPDKRRDMLYILTLSNAI